jgi:hypothetical protein
VNIRKDLVLKIQIKTVSKIKIFEINLLKEQVKQSRYRPGVAQRVPGS